MRKGVMRPGHVQIRVLDMEEAVKHYGDLMGLLPMGSDEQGRRYFKGWTEVDSFSVVLRETDEAGMDFMAFKVLDEATLDKLRQELIDFGGLESPRTLHRTHRSCVRAVRYQGATWQIRRG